MENRQVVFQGQRFDVARYEYATPDGRRHVREVVEHPGSVAIVPIVDEQHVCLICNRRETVGEMLIELPAGTLEPDEDPLHTAARELREETGYTAERVELLTTFYMSPGVMREKMHLYRATGLQLGDAAREPGEQIENLVLGWNEALERIASGEIRDAKTIAGLLYCERLLRQG